MAVIEESASDRLDSLCYLFVKEMVIWGFSWKLMTVISIHGFNPRLRGMLGLNGSSMGEFFSSWWTYLGMEISMCPLV